jgi:nickel/cobalt exporter
MAGLALTVPALGHPHIFIDARLVIEFDASGAVSGLRHAWTFDSANSAWMVQGLDADGDRVTSQPELQPLADENTAALADFGFYTFAGPSGQPMRFTSRGDQQMAFADGELTLSFGIDAITPLPVGGRFEVGVYDPEYYVAIGLDEAADVTLENAPGDCTVQVEPPQPMAPEVEQQLYALGPEVLELPPDLAAAMRGTQGLVAVVCGDAAPATTALEAVNQAGDARPATPFGAAPPPEPGLNLPRSGFFGWLQEQQRGFYGALTSSLDALRTDWTAFWVLGGLSFLYGVFHAAGPGHGKVVISTYMLANETQLRQGVWLSGLSSLLQSLVAIGFVLIAAGLLGMTSLAMSDATYWIGVLSYGLVGLLGLWLVLRKLFGFGHHHGHGDMAQTAHAHLHDHDHDHSGQHDGHHGQADHHTHDHAHVVAPQATGGDWREQLGVVLAVGARPCSGALVVMAFALSQGLLPAGIVAVLLMGLGTAITVGVLAAIAVSAKGLAVRIGGADNRVAATAVWWLELAGALTVLAFGVLLLIASL